MSAEKRAAYRGPSGTGVDLTGVELANGELRSVHVEQGAQLPTEIDGVRVSAAYRDRLLEQEDWHEARQATGNQQPAKGNEKE